MSEEYFRPEITFEDLEVGDIFISLDDRIDENGLYMKVHVVDFQAYPPKTTDRCLNFCTGNVFKIYLDTKVRKIQNQHDPSFLRRVNALHKGCEGE